MSLTAGRPEGRELRESVLGAVLVLAAGLAFRRVFVTADVARALPFAVLLPTAGVLAVRPGVSADVGRRDRTSLAVLAGLVGVLLAVLLAAVLATPEPGGDGPLAGALHAVAGGWRLVLTTALPAPGTPDRLPVLAVAAGLAAMATALLVRTTRLAISPLLPGVLLLVVALLLGVGGPVGPVAVTLPVGIAGLLLLAVRSVPEPDAAADAGPAVPAAASSSVGRGPVVSAATLQRGTAALAALVLAVLAGGLLGPHLPGGGGTPVDPREAVQPPLDLPQVDDPLSELGPRLHDPLPTEMFSAVVPPALTTTGGRRNWRQLTLDSYDGFSWSQSTHAVAVGTQLGPQAAGSGGSGADGADTATVSVHIAGLDGLWVPTPGPVVAVGRAGLGYDAAGQTLVDPAGVSSGRSYDVTSAISAPSAAALQRAAVGSGGNPALTALPACMPAVLRTMASAVTASLPRPDEKAFALEQALATTGGFAFSASAPAGHSCGRLADLVTSATRTGTSEQFASAYVLMARSVGLPARLAVGFAPGEVEPDQRTVDVMSNDAQAWPEVLLGNLGWVAFDPTPKRGAPPRPREDPPAKDSIRDTINNPTATTTTPPVASGPAARPPATAAAGFPVLLVVLLLALLVVLLPLSVPIAKAVRRRGRRARADPRTRTLGAWQEVLDRLDERGVATGSASPTEVLALVPASVGAPTLGGAVNAALFDPAPLPASVADAAWTDADALLRELARSGRVDRRVGHALDPRTLLRSRA